MNIFTPEYIVLAVTLMVVGCRIPKKPKTNEGSGESSMNNGKSTRLS